jgi:hypothetical protein
MSDRFTLQQHDDGDVYVFGESRSPHLSANLSDEAEPRIKVGVHIAVVIDKEYGPLVGFPLRITIDSQAADWVIERQGGDDVWREAARIPLQTEADFDDEPGAGRGSDA